MTNCRAIHMKYRTISAEAMLLRRPLNEIQVTIDHRLLQSQRFRVFKPAGPHQKEQIFKHVFYRPHSANCRHQGINNFWTGQLRKTKCAQFLDFLVNLFLQRLIQPSLSNSLKLVTSFKFFVYSLNQQLCLQELDAQGGIHNLNPFFIPILLDLSVRSSDVSCGDDCPNRAKRLNPSRTSGSRINGEHQYPRSRKNDHYARDRQISFDKPPHLIAQHLAFLLRKPTSFQGRHLACGGAE